jgi:hypothetical protein
MREAIVEYKRFIGKPGRGENNLQDLSEDGWIILKSNWVDSVKVESGNRLL